MPFVSTVSTSWRLMMRKHCASVLPAPLTSTQTRRRNSLRCTGSQFSRRNNGKPLVLPAMLKTHKETHLPSWSSLCYVKGTGWRVHRSEKEVILFTKITCISTLQNVVQTVKKDLSIRQPPFVILFLLSFCPSLNIYLFYVHYMPEKQTSGHVINVSILDTKRQRQVI